MHSRQGKLDRTRKHERSIQGQFFSDRLPNKKKVEGKKTVERENYTIRSGRTGGAEAVSPRPTGEFGERDWGKKIPRSVFETHKMNMKLDSLVVTTGTVWLALLLVALMTGPSSAKPLDEAAGFHYSRKPSSSHRDWVRVRSSRTLPDFISGALEKLQHREKRFPRVVSTVFNS